MATTHPVATRNALAATWGARLDAGSTNAAGAIKLRTAADAVAATLRLSNPAVGAPAAGAVTFNAITPDTNAVGGTATQATFENRDDVEEARCTVTGPGGGGDLEITDPVVAAGDTVQASTPPTYTGPN